MVEVINAGKRSIMAGKTNFLSMRLALLRVFVYNDQYILHNSRICTKYCFTEKWPLSCSSPPEATADGLILILKK